MGIYISAYIGNEPIPQKTLDDFNFGAGEFDGEFHFDTVVRRHHLAEIDFDRAPNAASRMMVQAWDERKPVRFPDNWADKTPLIYDGYVFEVTQDEVLNLRYSVYQEIEELAASVLRVAEDKSVGHQEEWIKKMEEGIQPSPYRDTTFEGVSSHLRRVEKITDAIQEGKYVYFRTW